MSNIDYELCAIAHQIDGINLEEKDLNLALNEYKASAKNKRILFILKDYHEKDKSFPKDLYFNQDENPIESINKISRNYNENFHPLRFYITRLNDKKNGSTFSKVAQVASFLRDGKKGKASYIVDSTYNEYTNKIAYININKELWYKTSSDKHVSAAYKKYRDILLAQIEIIDPGVIIFGGTFKFFFNDLNEKYHIGLLKTNNIVNCGPRVKFAPYVSKINPKKFILFETNHPRLWNSFLPDLFYQTVTKWNENDSNNLDILNEWTNEDIYLNKNS